MHLDHVDEQTLSAYVIYLVDKINMLLNEYPKINCAILAKFSYFSVQFIMIFLFSLFGANL